jgi:hypothetical protein
MKSSTDDYAIIRKSCYSLERDKEIMDILAPAVQQSAKEPTVTPEKDDASRAFKTCQLWEILAVATLLLMLVLQLTISAGRESATMDEQNHMARGLAYLRTGDTRYQVQ